MVTDRFGGRRMNANGPWLLAMRMAFWFLVALHPPAALAHLLQTDGDVGVLMHVDPGDEPVVGEPSTFLIEITDRREAFTLDACDCRLRVLQNDREVLSETLKGDKSASVAVPFVFADAGIYRAEVTGNPRPGAALRAFRVAFDVRVIPNDSPEVSGGSEVRKYGLPIAAAMAALIALAAFTRKRWRRK